MKVIATIWNKVKICSTELEAPGHIFLQGRGADFALGSDTGTVGTESLQM